MYPLGHILKVACVVKIKLSFMERFYYNLNYNKILYNHLDKALLFSRNQVFIWKFEKFKYPIVQYFLLKLRTHFLLMNYEFFYFV